MKKRIMSLILALTFVMCLPFVPASAASSTDYGIEAVTHLVNLNILPSGINPEVYMTRGEFAQAIYNLADDTVVLTGGYNFGDLAADHINYDAIQYCIQRGYMGGYSGLIRPDDLITYIEGMTVMARVLNYTDYAKYNGDYTVGYYTTAKKLGILKNTNITSSNDPMTYGDAAAMIYNSLRCSVNQLSEINSFYYTYKAVDRILAYDKLGLNYLSGIMYSNGLTDISGNDDLGKNLVVVDKFKLSSRNLDVSYRNLIGQSVSVFYDDDYNIVSIAPMAKNSTVRIRREDFGGFSGNAITYYVDNMDRKLQINSKAPIFLNGKPVLDFDATGFKNAEFGAVYTVDNDGDFVFDAIFVNVYTTFVVYSVDSEGVVSSLNDTNSVNLGEDNKKETVIYNASGDIISVQDIRPHSTISVIESDDFVYAVNTNSCIAGKVSQIDEYSVVINDLVCDVPNGTAVHFNGISPGAYANVYFDFDNRVVYVEKNNNLSSDILFGYLVDCELDTGFDKVLKMKIFTKNKEMKIFTARNKFQVDENPYTVSKLSGLPAEFLESGSLKNTIIMYKTNADGQITEIDFPATYLGANEDGFIKTYSKYKKTMDSSGHYGLKIFVNSNTTFFIVPDDLNDEEAYDVLVRSKVPNTTQTVDTFHFSKNNGYTDVVLIKGSNPSILTYSTPLSVVTRVTKGVDEDGDDVVRVTHFCDNVLTVSVAKDSAIMAEVIKYKPGDAVRLALLEDTITVCERVYEYDTGKYTKPAIQSDNFVAGSSIYTTEGYVVYDDYNYFRLNSTKDKITTSDIFQLDGFIYGSAKIMIVEDESKGVTVKAGTSIDVKTGDHVVLQLRGDATKYIIVYRDK